MGQIEVPLGSMYLAIPARVALPVPCGNLDELERRIAGAQARTFRGEPAWAVARAIGRQLCEGCDLRFPDLVINLPGNWLPTQVCAQCMWEHDGYHDNGWRQICSACLGDGDATGEGLFECKACDGEGVLA